MGWSDIMSRDDFLRRIRDGVRRELSASKIAAEIGHGTTKGMVIGAASRAKIQLGTDSSRAAAARRTVKARKPVRSPAKPPQNSKAKKSLPSIPPPKPKFGPVHLLEHMDGQCRMPLWPSFPSKARCDQHIYCGARVTDGGSWCPECRKRIFMSPSNSNAATGDGRRRGWQYGT